jgi:RNA polymerase sigma-70 factor (ECF subfamily)
MAPGTSVSAEPQAAVTEAPVLRQLGLSDPSAFDEISRRHGTRLKTVAERVVRCSETAAEVVQDVLLRVWRDRASIEIRGHLGGYLARAVRNRALDLHKRHRLESRWLERETAAVGQVERERIQAPLLGAPEDREDREERLALAVDRLPGKRREVILLRWRDDLSYADIARRLGISAKTVETQINRGLRALRASLREPGEESARPRARSGGSVNGNQGARSQPVVRGG